MKKSLLVLVLVFFFVGLTQNAHAWRKEYWYKLRRGATNVITAPAEIPKQVKSLYEEGREKSGIHVTPWILSGFVKGIGYTGLRLGSGLWDMLTFNLEFPKDFRPIMEPEYVFDSWNEEDGQAIKKESP